VLGAVVLVGALAVSGCGAAPVGIVDGRRLLNESVLALSYQKQLDDREKAMASDLRLLASTLSKEDLEARRTVFQQDLAKLKQSLEEQLNAQIRKSVAEVARKRRLRVVLIQQTTLVGGVDVTADVIERLK
jgi:Skp family chaperone for outer membrane proteins